MQKILLVDDDPRMIECLCKMVPWDKVGYTVCGTASNGSEAMEAVSSCHPDVVLTDVKMPVMDGIEFCRYLKEQYNELPVILFSAYEDMETARLAMKYNVTEYLLKPITAYKIELLCTILRDLAHNRQQEHFFVDICSCSDRQEDILCHLRNGDVDWMTEFFTTFADCLNCPFLLIRNAAAQLLRIFNADNKENNSSLTLHLEKLYTFYSKADIARYVSGIYMSRLSARMEDAGEDSGLDILVRQVKQYVNQNFMLPQFCMDMAADRFHFSAGYLNRMFTRQTGETINAYVIRRRIETAKDLLRNFALPVSEIASSCGFSDSNYFARAFRKQTGMSPSEYRNGLRLFEETADSIYEERNPE